MDKNFAKKKTHPVLIFWIIVGWVSYLVVPWYGVEDGFFRFEWLFDGYPFDPDYAPAAFLLVQGKKLWLAPIIIIMLILGGLLILAQGSVVAPFIYTRPSWC